MNLMLFVIQHDVQIPRARFDAYRVWQLEDNELLSHELFGETRTAITDGVHAFALFGDRVREVMHDNLHSKRPNRGDSPKKAPNKTNETKKLKRLLDLADF